MRPETPEEQEKRLRDEAAGAAADEAYVATVIAANPILKYFAHAHLPARLGTISRAFSDLAWGTIMDLPPGAERTTALRKLLESKDCAVRAAL